MNAGKRNECITGAIVAAGALLLVSVVTASASGHQPWSAHRSVARAAKQQEQNPAAQDQKLADEAPQEQFAAKDDKRPAEQVYKNIQVLKEMPAGQVLEAMKSFTRVLGVRCEHCHVTAPGSKIPGFGAFSKDDLEAKQTARKMITMSAEIRDRYFAPKEGPTCWTCHRGSIKPEFLPAPPAAPGGK